MIESYQIMLKYIFNDCEQIKPLIDEFTNKEKAKKKYAELQLQIKAVKKEKGLTKIDQLELRSFIDRINNGMNRFTDSAMFQQIPLN